MNLKKIKEERLKALHHAYTQQIKVLNADLKVDQVEPDKMNTSLKAYKTAAEESEFVLSQIIDLTEELKSPEQKAEEASKIVKKESKGLSPEKRKR